MEAKNNSVQGSDLMMSDSKDALSHSPSDSKNCGAKCGSSLSCAPVSEDNDHRCHPSSGRDEDSNSTSNNRESTPDTFVASGKYSSLSSSHTRFTEAGMAEISAQNEEDVKGSDMNVIEHCIAYCESTAFQVCVSTDVYIYKFRHCCMQ